MTASEVKIRPTDGDISEYITNFNDGKLQIPPFQRDFVWDTDQKIELFRSIAKGYPIGSILLWQPNEATLELFEYANNNQILGGYIVPKKNNNSFYILDGFQRLSTLVGALKNPLAHTEKVSRNEEIWHKEFNFVYNLEAEDFEVVKTKDPSKLKIYQIPIYKLIDGRNFYNFQRSLFHEKNTQADTYLNRYEAIGHRFSKYKIPQIQLTGGSVSEAIDIFQKLNSQGSKITTDWIISASLMKKDPTFRLGDEITNLIENDLRPFQFHTIKREIILNCITNSFGGVYFDVLTKNDSKKLETLIANDNFIATTKKTFDAIKKAAQFMYKNLMVLEAKLIPYNNQFIFITDFFNNIENPTATQLSELSKWFWITTYSNYFTIYNLSKQRSAYQQFQLFVKENKNPVYYDNDSKFVALAFPDKITMGSVRGKALALFMIHWSKNGKVLLNNQIDSLNYQTFKLFSTKENMIPENTIFQTFDSTSPNIIDNFLGKSQEELFITEEMCAPNNKDNDAVLASRKLIILQKEKAFILSLGIEYED